LPEIDASPIKGQLPANDVTPRTRGMFLPRKCSVDDAWDGVLSVPFEQKDAAKALGAQWDVVRRTWVVPPALRARRSEFCAWDKHSRTEPAVVPQELQLKRESIDRELIRAVCGGHA
jgi:hypothetical protein